jgi:type I restriction-modification system DNA methylase subunit
MESLQNKIVSFIWSIADDCLRDVYVRGKYRDVILPMFVLRRLDCLLEVTKEAVTEEVRFQREEAGFTLLDAIAWSISEVLRSRNFAILFCSSSLGIGRGRYLKSV